MAPSVYSSQLYRPAMFITDQLTPAEMLSELLSLKGYRKADTERFKDLRHDKHLCPAFRDRVSAMLDAYKSHRADVYDIQSPRDEGIDVLLSYEYDDGKYRLGLQIKSQHELAQWAKGRDDKFVATLKAQYTTAIQNVKVEHYYLLLCVDEIEYDKQLRFICSELKQFSQLTIVMPRQALALYEMTDYEVNAFVTRILCRHDSALWGAMHEIDGVPKDRAYITLALLCKAFEGTLLLADKDLLELHQEWLDIHPDDDPQGDRISWITQELQGRGLRMEDTLWKIELGELPVALCALYFHQKLMSTSDLLPRLVALLIPGKHMKRYRAGRRRFRPPN